MAAQHAASMPRLILHPSPSSERQFLVAKLILLLLRGRRLNFLKRFVCTQKCLSGPFWGERMPSSLSTPTGALFPCGGDDDDLDTKMLRECTARCNWGDQRDKQQKKGTLRPMDSQHLQKNNKKKHPYFHKPQSLCSWKLNFSIQHTFLAEIV